MLVKICGVTTEEAAQAAAEAGVDLIGFVFTESKREISPDAAAAIASRLPASVQTVGVFVNEAPAVMERIASKVGLDFIQLHGEEPPRVASSLSRKVIKAFPAEKERLENVHTYPCDYFLIDTPSVNRGGSGKTFDWSLLQETGIDREKLLLAGGLHPDNVQEAVAAVNPFAVDVSSGVETEGKKDPEKMKAFINQAKHREANKK
ncbi:phosphoribosylanthranilate isomerase [Oceanobacillus alkalisoli]|uniref:phosphoribosylanthranilate isomerase n=1 Tax=Oceanobacillus alkalisoli TaxID=2925113 RepID=UPI001F121477|nr:phosphoribosylanthranilate isomerase [Oceanobacillus alkalisoli]MCF3944569.1 phosphoribosylanthranilate isomerase [Oceanobacillus alkalisoli]